MRMEKILEMERVHRNQVIDDKIKQSKQENTQRMILLGISVIESHISMSATALMCAALRDS